MASNASVASLVITVETGLSDEEGPVEPSHLGEKSWLSLDWAPVNSVGQSGPGPGLAGHFCVLWCVEMRLGAGEDSAFLWWCACVTDGIELSDSCWCSWTVGWNGPLTLEKFFLWLPVSQHKTMMGHRLMSWFSSSFLEEAFPTWSEWFQYVLRTGGRFPVWEPLMVAELRRRLTAVVLTKLHTFTSFPSSNSSFLLLICSFMWFGCCFPMEFQTVLSLWRFKL